MTVDINTKLYAKVRRERAAAQNADRYIDTKAYDFQAAVAAGTMLVDGPDLRRQLLAMTETWRGVHRIKRCLGYTVIGGVEPVLAKMVKDGHLHHEQWHRNYGRWKWVKMALRPLDDRWKRSDAGTVELRRLERAAAASALAARRSR